VGNSLGHCWVLLDNMRERTAAHEMGHTFGLGHVQACEEAGPYESYPYPAKQISWGGVRDYWGTSLRTYPPSILPGAKWSDIMTYCDYKWISPYTYGKLRTKLRSAMTASSAGTAAYSVVRPLAGTEYLMALGMLGSEEISATLISTLRVDGADLDPEAHTSPDGVYALQLLAHDGQVLDEVTFGGQEGPHQEEGMPFGVLIPWHAATVRVVVSHEGRELASEPLSAHAPVVSFDPVSDVVTNTLTCSWTASDGDGDDLTATLLFSHDDGETWEAVGSGIAYDRFEADTTLWPETGQGRLRLLVSDGLHTTEAVSNRFSVPARPPLAFIVEPGDDAVLLPDQPVFLRATGFDAEDGPLSDEAYGWSSDRDGPLGVGEDVVADGLSEGWHRITLLATDSDGHVAEDGIRVLVGSRVWLPMCLK